MPSSGSCLALASRFSKRSVSRESIQPDCRLHRCLRHQVSLLTLCPLGQPKKAIGRESEIEPWLTHAQRNRLACPRFRKSTGVHICFPSSAMVSERSSPSRVRFAAPKRRALDRSGPFGRTLSFKRERQRVQTSSRLGLPMVGPDHATARGRN